MKFVTEISEDTMKTRVLQALSRLCGRGRNLSVEELANLSGESVATIRSYMAARNSASLWRFWRLLSACDPRDASAALNHVLAPLGFRAVPLDQSALVAAASLAALTQTATALAEALIDGRIDHQERHQLAESARQLQHHLDALQRDPGDPA